MTIYDLLGTIPETFNVFVGDAIRGFEKIADFLKLACACCCSFFSRKQPVIEPATPTPRYPRYCYEEIYGLSDYDAVYPPSETELQMRKVAEMMKATGFTIRGKQKPQDYRYLF